MSISADVQIIISYLQNLSSGFNLDIIFLAPLFKKIVEKILLLQGSRHQGLFT